jgi:hypothetical protein
MVFAMQLLSGENLIGQGVQLCVSCILIYLSLMLVAWTCSFKQAGLGTVASFDVNLALNSVRPFFRFLMYHN